MKHWSELRKDLSFQAVEAVPAKAQGLHQPGTGVPPAVWLQSSACAAAVLEPAVLASLSDGMLMAAGGGRQPTVHQAPLPRGLPDKSSLPAAEVSIKVSFSLETPGIILKRTPG